MPRYGGAILAALLAATTPALGKMNSAFDVPIAEAFTGAVVGVFSMATRSLVGERSRDGLRHTWMHDPSVYSDLGIRMSPRKGKKLRHSILSVFVIGKPHTGGNNEGSGVIETDSSWSKTLEDLKNENRSYGDIVYLPVTEDLLSFRKPEAWYAFAVKRFPRASHIARIDEDVYVRGSCMGPIIERMPKKNFYWGWASFGAAQRNEFRGFPMVGSKNHRFKSTGPAKDGTITHSCEPYANGGFLWVSRDVAEAIVEKKTMTSDPSRPYPFVGEDLFFSCFVNDAMNGRAPLHMLIGSSKVQPRTAHDDFAWHARRDGIFSELVYGQKVHASTVVIHGKNFAGQRFTAQRSASHIAVDVGALRDVQEEFTAYVTRLLTYYIANGNTPSERYIDRFMPLVKRWNFELLQVLRVGTTSKRASVAAAKAATMNTNYYAYLTSSEKAAHAAVAKVEDFIHGCVNRTQAIVTFWSMYTLGLLENQLTPTLATPPSAAALVAQTIEHCAGAGAAFPDLVPKPLPAAASATPMTRVIHELLSWLDAANRTVETGLMSLTQALGKSAAASSTLFDTVALGAANRSCPVPWLPKVVGIDGVTTAPTDGAQCGCTYFDRFVPYQAASSMRFQYRATDAESGILDQRSFSAFAFDCDMSSSWNSAWIAPDVPLAALCPKLAAIGVHSAMASLPQWIKFPEQPAHGRDSAVIQAFSIRSVSYGNLEPEMVKGPWPRLKIGGKKSPPNKGLPKDDIACNLVTPRGWRLEASPLKGSHSGVRWESIAASSPTDSPWACGEERWFTVLEDERIDLKWFMLRLLITEVGGRFGPCNTTFVGIGEISVLLEGETKPPVERDLKCGGAVAHDYPKGPRLHASRLNVTQDLDPAYVQSVEPPTTFSGAHKRRPAKPVKVTKSFEVVEPEPVIEAVKPKPVEAVKPMPVVVAPVRAVVAVPEPVVVTAPISRLDETALKREPLPTTTTTTTPTLPAHTTTIPDQVVVGDGDGNRAVIRRHNLARMIARGVLATFLLICVLFRKRVGAQLGFASRFAKRVCSRGGGSGSSEGTTLPVINRSQGRRRGKVARRKKVKKRGKKKKSKSPVRRRPSPSPLESSDEDYY